MFEGHDDQSFYINHFPANIEFDAFVTFGKANSIELYNSLDWTKYSKERIIFFIDRDYDRILGIPVPEDLNIYETTFYSIENYVVNENILRRAIRELFHFYDGDVINAICELFRDSLTDFTESIKPIVTWILFVRNKGLRPNLNNIDLSAFFGINSSLILTKPNVDRIQLLNKFTQVTTPPFTLSEYKRLRVQIEQIPEYKMYLRGKFELWFFLRFLNEVHIYLNNVGHKKSQKTSITATNSLEVLGPRVPCPARLFEFIRGIFNVA